MGLEHPIPEPHKTPCQEILPEKCQVLICLSLEWASRGAAVAQAAIMVPIGGCQSFKLLDCHRRLQTSNKETCCNGIPVTSLPVASLSPVPNRGHCGAIKSAILGR